jgi:hypothetical protein
LKLLQSVDSGHKIKVLGVHERGICSVDHSDLLKCAEFWWMRLLSPSFFGEFFLQRKSKDTSALISLFFIVAAVIFDTLFGLPGKHK